VYTPPPADGPAFATAQSEQKAPLILSRYSGCKNAVNSRKVMCNAKSFAEKYELYEK
jgi:trehalose-6-phosphate synthase